MTDSTLTGRVIKDPSRIGYYQAVLVDVAGEIQWRDWKSYPNEDQPRARLATKIKGELDEDYTR